MSAAPSLELYVGLNWIPLCVSCVRSPGLLAQLFKASAHLGLYSSELKRFLLVIVNALNNHSH